MSSKKGRNREVAQNWSKLREGQKVSVSEPGKESYRAQIDAIHEDKVVWVVSENGQQRRAFDYREGIIISSL